MTHEASTIGSAAAPDQAVMPPADNGALASASWLLCRTGSHRFALPVADVVETMRMLPIKPVGGAPPLLLGLCVIRGVATPVLDPVLLFDHQPGRYQRLVTARTGARTVAFAVEAVIGVRAVGAQVLGQLPPLLSNVASIAAIAALDAELVFFLQTARVVPEVLLDACLGAGEDA
jgi:purine-binding chemotaxis protein CheW